MEVEAPTPRERDLDANFIDDEDLQAALSRSRRQKVNKARAKMTPEDIAKRRTYGLSSVRMFTYSRTSVAEQREEEAQARAIADVTGVGNTLENGVDEDEKGRSKKLL